ncbi:Holliday junction ATP-dependent DNA helicase RuvA [Bienertia sinuspersici]
MSEPPELVTTLMVPNDDQRLYGFLADACKQNLLLFLLDIVDHNPNIVNKADAIMIWNVQGAGSHEFQSALKELNRIRRPKVLTLVETHIGDDYAQKLATTLGFNGHYRMDAQGFCGGIWVYWHPDQVTIHPITYSHQHITMQISHIGEIPWHFSAVYVSPNPSKRQDL